MGNSSSTSSSSNKSAEKSFNNFYDIIDHIATYYILTMDFKSLSKLCEKEYCDKLVVITSDIIKRYFNDMEVTYLAQRVKDGLEINDLTKEKVIFVNKDQLETLDISNDAQKNLKKKRVCIGIAKFYIKIAHIFAAIVMTVNPVYSYKDSTGQTVKTGLMEKDKIPRGVNRQLYKFNICDNRIKALLKGQEPKVSSVPTSVPTSVIEPNQSIPNLEGPVGGANTFDDEITMQPKICDMNVNKDGTSKSLIDEPGIQELMQLYLDDKYDYSNGTFTGMSNETEKQFQQDLKTFYTAFTGNDVMPPEITKFSDIKLKDYSKLKGCQGDTPTLKNKYTINKNDKLFVEYAKNTQNMIQNAATNQSKLLDVINELFSYVIDPYTGKQKIRVNPKLTEESLQKSVEKTRKLIIALYVECEMGYVRGIKIYEAIVEAKILETTQKQIDSLKKEATQIIDDTTKVVNKPTPVNLDVKPPVNLDVKPPVNPPVNLDVNAHVNPPVNLDVNAPVNLDVNAPVNLDVNAPLVPPLAPLNPPVNNTQNIQQNKYPLNMEVV